jgi:hypothetical protein
MRQKGQAAHTQETERDFGTLFDGLSIDQAARECASAAKTWGGGAVVFVDAKGRCSAAIEGMPATNRAIQRDMWSVVGTYYIASVDIRAKQYRDTVALIAEDIWHHWKLLSEAAA